MASTSVKQEYVKDPSSGNNVSPITDISTVGLSNGQFYSSNYFDYRKTVFAARKNNISVGSLQYFNSYSFAGWTVDIGSENIVDNYFVDKELNESNYDSATYEIYIKIEAAMLNGTHTPRELFASITVNGSNMYADVGDNYGYWLPQLYDRACGTHKTVHGIPKGGKVGISLGLFSCNSTTLTENYTYGSVEVVLIREPKVSQKYIVDNYSEGTIPAKYVKNADGNLVSPITSAQSVYFNGSSGSTTIKSAKEVGDYIPKMVYQSYGIGTNNAPCITYTNPSTLISPNVLVQNAVNIGIHYESPYISSSNNITKETTIGVSGYYFVEMTIRPNDALGSRGDTVAYLYVNSSRRWLGALRHMHRRSIHGSSYLHLSKGDKVGFGFFSDVPISSVYNYTAIITILKKD